MLPALLAEVGLDHALVVADLLRAALGDLLAVVEHGDVLRDAHDHLHVVLDQQDRHAALVAQLLHELGEPRRLLRVHARRSARRAAAACGSDASARAISTRRWSP